MANYILLERIELNASAASVTFANIPQSGYTDLKVVYSARTTDSASWNVAYIKFNTDTTAANYPTRYLFAFSTTVGSSTGNQFAGYLTSTAMTSNTFSNNEIYVPNYLSSTSKSFSVDSVTEGNSATLIPSQLTAGRWTDTSAINQITLTPDAGSFAANSTFSLYGLAAVGTTPAIAPKASGGDVIDYDGTYWIHTFLTSGTFTPQTGLTCDALVVAGGGAGGGAQTGGYISAGAGAGGYRTASSFSVTSATNYTVTVGAGGAASSSNFGGNGNNSVFSTITSSAGGGGAGCGFSSPSHNGRNGGSGGGSAIEVGGAVGTVGTGNSGSYSPVEGFAGGLGNTSGFGGAGGGSSAVGTAATQPSGSSPNRAGGAGTANSISGSSVTYATGGNSGNSPADSAPVAGAANTGNGGSGVWASASAKAGGAGGSGIVIIRYLAA